MNNLTFFENALYKCGFVLDSVNRKCADAYADEILKTVPKVLDQVDKMHATNADDNCRVFAGYNVEGDMQAVELSLDGTNMVDRRAFHTTVQFTHKSFDPTTPYGLDAGRACMNTGVIPPKELLDMEVANVGFKSHCEKKVNAALDKTIFEKFQCFDNGCRFSYFEVRAKQNNKDE